MKKRMIALVGVLALVIAACGGNGTDATTTSSAPDSTSTTAPTPDSTTTTEAGDDRADWPDSIRFGFVPSRESETLQDNVSILADILAEALDIDVEGFVTPDYPSLILAMGTGDTQLGALPPRGYVDGSTLYPNIELLAQSERNGSLFYHTQYFTNDPSVCDGDPEEGAFTHAEDGSILAVAVNEVSANQVGWEPGNEEREEGIDAGLRCPSPVGLDVVEGGIFAFVSEGSASGHLFPLGQLIDAGLVGGSYTQAFGGSHTGSVVMVYNGDADFGASFDDARTTATAELPDVGSKVIVFNISSPIPNDVLAIDADLPESFKDAVYQALADYIATDEGLELMREIYDWTGLVRAGEQTEQAMEIIRAAIEALD